MKTLSILLLPIIMISCGKIKENLNPFEEIDTSKAVVGEEFKPFVALFDFEFNIKSNTSVRFKEGLRSNIAGYCDVYSNGKKVVTINKDIWEIYSYSRRELLIFHEFLHCEFNLSHDDSGKSTVSNNYECPNSLVNTHIFTDFITENCYIDNRDDYIDYELNKIFN